MTDYVIAPDISHYQPTLTTSYPRDFVVFKMTQGTTYLDSHFLANAGVAHSLHASGKLAGAVCYHVYSTDSADAQFAKIKAALGPIPPDWLAGVMIDLESWPGTSYAIHGDQSAGVNRLYGLLIAWLGSARACWLYGNAGDLAGLAPHRDTRAPIVLAAYTSDLRYRDYAGGLGQQYTNGQTDNPVPVIDAFLLPRSTTGLGNCDHNVFPGFKNGAALRAWMHPTPPPERDWFDMATKQDLADVVSAYFTSDAGQTAIAGGVRQAVANHPGEFSSAVLGTKFQDKDGVEWDLRDFCARFIGANPGDPLWVKFFGPDGVRQDVHGQPIPNATPKG